ncbi:MAG: LPS-assembly protein LptD [Flavobacteriales bacterium]|nr:LPS-assembly protein LptD [Flavobacteriales bacterium]
MNIKIIIVSLFIFLLTGIFNNSWAKPQQITEDTLSNVNKEEIIEYHIERYANDSIIQDLENKKILLFGNAKIIYGDITISANYIEIDWNNSTINAKPTTDSIGEFIGFPVFTEGKDSFKATEILYNFKSKKCIVSKIITKEGEGYIHGLKVKKMEDNVLYLKKGQYTTCDKEKPHYSIKANKIKLVPKKQIVTGPAYLTFFNIPAPLLLPFGFFPNTSKESSGILIPSYGESANLGFFLKDGGYYFTLNDYMDFSVKGDIYTKGSWRTKTNFRYKNRYKYNGNLKVNLGKIINSEKGFPDYSEQKDFFIRWNHRQDPKANPTFSFSANVNAGSNTYHKNNTFSNTKDYLTNTFSSSINLSKRWEGTPFNISSNLGHNQNTKTQKVNLTLPNIDFSMNRIFPFKELGKSGKKYWYHKVGIRYNMNTKNELSVADSLLFHNSTLSSFNSGMRHNIPISSSFKMFKYFTVSQNINLSERWYLSQIQRTWNGSEVITDTLDKFTRGGEYNLSSSINTKIYGIAQFKKGKIAAFRHVLTPNLSFNYNPSFADEKFGFYKSVQSDSLGNTEIYSITENGIYGSPRKNESGNITLNLSNIFGMKIRTKKDTTETIKKIKLIESLNINSSYNIFADSLNFSNISLNLRTKLFNSLNITFSSNFDPYVKTNNGRLNTFEFSENKRLARFTNSNTSIGFSLSDKTFKKSTVKDTLKVEEEARDFYNIPWNLNMNYTYSFNKGHLSSAESISNQNISFSGNLKITPKWKIGFHSGYDFTDKEFTYTSLDLYRDLHCWEMLFHWIPTGFHRSYTLTIRVKAPMLKDLKLERKKDWINPDFN